ncbi:MAG: hypothetical protein U1F43_20585 [Myxococcota bacterium]
MSTLAPIVLVLTAAWHALAVWHFTATPARTIARTTHERPVSPVAVELLRFLGAFNVGYAALALLAAFVFPASRPLAFVVLALANVSQAIVDLRVQRLGLARGPMFKQILAGDVVFTIANAALFVVALA